MFVCIINICVQRVKRSDAGFGEDNRDSRAITATSDALGSELRIGPGKEKRMRFHLKKQRQLAVTRTKMTPRYLALMMLTPAFFSDANRERSAEALVIKAAQFES